MTETAVDIEAEIRELRAEITEATIANAVYSQARDRRIRDAEAAVALIDRSLLVLDDDAHPRNVNEAIDSLLEQRPWLVGEPLKPKPKLDPDRPLTHRERDMLRMLGNGQARTVPKARVLR